MKRRTLDVLFSLGGLALAGLLLVAGIVLTANANFANNYVRDQLTQQNITFKTADTLTDEEKAQPCLVENAGKQLTTGKQAECYANNFIGLHLESTADGKTYAELGTPSPPCAPRSPKPRRPAPPTSPTCRSNSPTSPANAKPSSRAKPCAASCSPHTASANSAPKPAKPPPSPTPPPDSCSCSPSPASSTPTSPPRPPPSPPPNPRAKDLVNAQPHSPIDDLAPRQGLDRHFRVSTLHRISWSPRP